MAKFCDACHTVLKLIKVQPQQGSGHHHRSYQAFQEAVAGGCCVCKRYEREHQGPFRDRVTAFSMAYTYQWEANKVKSFKSGLPANTVAVLLGRDDADATDLKEREYWSIPRVRLNLVPELPHERTQSSILSMKYILAWDWWQPTRYQTHWYSEHWVQTMPYSCIPMARDMRRQTCYL